MQAGRKPIAVLGPTAGGKSRLAEQLAKATNGEIINCDSVQVYRGFDIGSAKPTLEQRDAIPHHLYDICEWHEDFDAGAYAKLANAKIDEIITRGHTPIVVGGTGLYFRALVADQFHEGLPKSQSLRARFANWQIDRVQKMLQRLDPVRAGQIHPNDRYRLERALELRILRKLPMTQLSGEATESDKKNHYFIVLVNPEPELLRQNIKLRVDQMFDKGLISEVRQLLNVGVDQNSKVMQSIGYKEAVLFLLNKIDFKECKERVFFATCQYAKRQRTWFKNISPDCTVDSVDRMDEIIKAYCEKFAT